MNKNRITKLINTTKPWKSESLYFDSAKYFEHLLTELETAKQYIEIECYIFSWDSLGKRVIEKLLEAVKRGVFVQLIIDGLGSNDWQPEQLSKLTQAGIEIKIYHPLPWHRSLYQQVKIEKGSFYKFLYLLSQINIRDHRKLYIIDKNVAFTGSLNITDSHLPNALTSRNYDWLDCGLKLRGKTVSDLSAVFSETWQGTSLHKLGRKQLPFRTNNNMIKRQRENLELIRLIRDSKKKIWITSAYLAPSKRVIKALQRAKRRDVDVKILVSEHSDVFVFPLVSTTYYQSLLSSGVEIYEYNQRIVHAKVMMLDDILIVGSSNLNHRSFLHDLELDIILSQQSSLDDYSKKFEKLLQDANRVTEQQLNRQSWHRRLLGKLIWRIRYWL